MSGTVSSLVHLPRMFSWNAREQLKGYVSGTDKIRILIKGKVWESGNVGSRKFATERVSGRQQSQGVVVLHKRLDFKHAQKTDVANKLPLVAIRPRPVVLQLNSATDRAPAMEYCIATPIVFVRKIMGRMGTKQCRAIALVQVLSYDLYRCKHDDCGLCELEISSNNDLILTHFILDDCILGGTSISMHWTPKASWEDVRAA
ncbi:hypothetical protein EV421DRAFT_1747564 [Armillaria borealis]|uniref:Uncharacterized protein n=1 Tax=Armillaria borealis TaxID=47425 RepID=A0AA39IBW1_9AGAR|nr:hypothetical protein EV421DRAFT_1747564 [Armillaria borealis]